MSKITKFIEFGHKVAKIGNPGLPCITNRSIEVKITGMWSADTIITDTISISIQSSQAHTHK